MAGSPHKLPGWLTLFCRQLWSVLLFIWVSIALAMMVGIVGGILLLPKGTDIQTLILGYPVAWITGHLLLTIVGVVGLVALHILAWAGSRQERAYSKQPIIVEPTAQDRESFLEVLGAYYTKRLSYFLQGEKPMALNLHELDVKRALSEHPEDAEHELPEGASILSAYKDAGGHGLLILGEAGTGKTLFMYELACKLLEHARNQPGQPVPVILNLSSWIIKKQALEDWLAKELRNIGLNVPRHFIEVWMQQRQILLLLDGLDEVQESMQTDYVAAINSYQAQYFGPVVVCCRSREYLELARKKEGQLDIPGTVVIQRLSIERVRAYLAQAGKPMAAIRTALSTNPVLQEIITTPLMLNVVMQTYRDKTVEDLPQIGSAEEQQRQIFASYIKNRLEHQPGKARYTSGQIMFWLTWLAHRMNQRSQTVFYIERMQPDWLPDYHSGRRYRSLYQGLLGLIVSGLAGLLIGSSLGIIIGLQTRGGFLNVLSAALWSGFFGMLILGLIGLLAGLLSRAKAARKQDIKPIGIVDRSWKGIWKGMEQGFSAGQEQGIKPVEIVDWSWKRLRQGFFAGLMGGAVCGLLVIIIWGIAGAFYVVQGTWKLTYAIQVVLLSAGGIALFLGYFFGLFFGLYSAFTGKMRDERMLAKPHEVKPNQGMRDSARNALSFGLILWLVIGLGIGLPVGLGGVALYRDDISIAVEVILMIFFTFGLWAAMGGLLNFGGSAYIQHLVLRCLLWRAGYIPLNYVRFLDYADKCILLQRAGAGFEFIHKLLLEHFAALDLKSPSDSMY